MGTIEERSPKETVCSYLPSKSEGLREYLTMRFHPTVLPSVHRSIPQSLSADFRSALILFSLHFSSASPRASPGPRIHNVLKATALHT